MAMNAGLYSSKNDQWETPPELFESLNKEFAFSLDTCAVPSNAKCERYFTPEQNGLTQQWEGTCWCNPPYGRQIYKWVQKAFRSSLKGATVVMLLPARTDTAWFHDLVLHRAEIRFLRGRIKFGGAIYSAPFPSMVVIYRGCKFGDT